MPDVKYQILARRYRPRRFSEVIGQEATVTTLKNAIRQGKTAQAYLFCGSRGVGKTTLARLFAKVLNCQEKGPDLEPCNQCPSCLEIGSGQSFDVIEIDGASNRGIDDIRQINETAFYAPSQGRYKIYIIDEVHMLTKEAFNALLKTLEEPPEKAKFFFATTEPHKVLPTIISRCQRFDLGRIQSSQIIGKLEQIAADLGRSCEIEALHLIATFSDGSLRDAETLFDQILCFAEGPIAAGDVRQVLGLVSTENFFALDQAFSEARLPFAFELVEMLFSSGKDLTHFYEQLIEHVRTLTCARFLGEKGLFLPPALSARYLQSSHLYASSQCLYLLEYLLRSESSFQKSASQRVALESILLHYIQSKHRIPVEILVRRLSEMEDRLKKDTLPLHNDPMSPSLKLPENAPLIPSHMEPIAKPLFEPSQPPGLSSIVHSPKEPSISEKRDIEPIEEPLPKGRSSFVPEKGGSCAPHLSNNSLDSAPQDRSCSELPVHTSKSSPMSLKPVPFNPSRSLEKPALPTFNPEPVCATQSTSPDVHPSHYDVLMRFAAVELEGTLKLNL